MVYFSHNYYALEPTNHPYGDGILLEVLDRNRIELKMENLYSSNCGDEADPAQEMNCNCHLSMEEAQELAWALLKAVTEVRFKRTPPDIEERQRQRIKEGKCSSDY